MEINGDLKVRVDKKKLAFYIILITAFIGLLIYLGLKFGPQLTSLASKPSDLRELLSGFGWKGVLVFIGIQVLQVVVAAIPGEFVQLAGGYVYGTWLGTIYSLAGIVAGSVIVFFVARLLGYPLVNMLVPPKQLEKFNFMINSDRSEIAMFLLFLIPGLPKDILTYIAGITPVKPLRFFVIITIGRLPALLASSYIGYSTQKGNYAVVAVLSAAALILFAAGIILKDRIIRKVHSMSEAGRK